VDPSTLSHEAKRKAVDGRLKSRWFQLVFNLAILAFFGYGWAAGISQLQVTWWWVILLVFGINFSLIAWQIRSLRYILKRLDEHPDPLP
jgi:hypothetical protein